MNTSAPTSADLKNAFRITGSFGSAGARKEAEHRQFSRRMCPMPASAPDQRLLFCGLPCERTLAVDVEVLDDNFRRLFVWAERKSYATQAGGHFADRLIGKH